MAFALISLYKVIRSCDREQDTQLTRFSIIGRLIGPLSLQRSDMSLKVGGVAVPALP